MVPVVTHTSLGVMYDTRVKRLQIMIEEELDEALTLQARAEGTSKAALIRRYVRKHVKPGPSIRDDPLWDLVGSVEGGSDDSLSVDDVVYPRE
jgi:Ribbon-helix-helix protein, copG family